MLFLTNCGITFKEDTHEYFRYDGKQLKGITGILSRQLFKDDYTDIPQSVLDAAAEYGSSVHKAIQEFECDGVLPPTTRIWQVNAYHKMIEGLGRKTELAEHLVTDYQNYASAIDCVLDDLSLVDIKCTSVLHLAKVTWQLSIYAYLLELNNIDMKVNRLYVTWIPKKQYGEPKIVECERIPDSEIIRLLECDAMGEQFEPSHLCPKSALPEPTKKNIPATAEQLNLAKSVIDSIIEVQSEYERIKKAKEEFDAMLLAKMEESNLLSVDLGQIKITRVASSIIKKRTLDVDRLFKEHKEINQEDYMNETETIRKSSLRLTIRNGANKEMPDMRKGKAAKRIS